MPGKRKRDEDEDQTTVDSPATHGSTIFVSNLPYTATSTDLQTLFSDIAPIKTAFVVLDKETKVSKGVGYVTFAIKEEAEKCVQDGKAILNGRMLRVSWAGQKPKQGESSPEKTARPHTPKKASIHHPKTPADPLAIRTIVVSSLPPAIEAKALWKKVRKQDGAEKLVFPAPNPDGTTDPTTAHVVFSTPSQAQFAAEHLHAHVFKGALLSVLLKKRLEKPPNRSSRLIIRNLPWNVTEQELRALFLSHGPVSSVNIPKEKGESPREDEGGPSKSRLPKAKGFAFVWMLSRGDAEKALQDMNGKRIGGRPIAVDWALSKERWEGEKGRLEEEAKDRVPDTDSDGDFDSEGDDCDSDEASDEDGLGVHEDDADSIIGSDGDSVNEDESDRGEPVKPQLPQIDTGTTIFIRNVPYEATEDQLRTLFRAFGPLRYVRITIDHETERSRGTAFACFWQREDADKVIQLSETLNKETGFASRSLSPAKLKNAAASLPSLLTPDPSSSLARSLVIHGRTLDVTRAVTRDEAAKLKDEGIKKREKEDKRNIYLMREGVIFPNTPAASTLPAVEVEKRVSSFNQRRVLLRSNPSLYVSKTRLSVRQLPTFVSERILKKLALHACKAFEKEVKDHLRAGLTSEEFSDTAAIQQLRKVEETAAAAEKNESGKGGFKLTSRMKQAKIVRLSDRVDPLTGKGRSKGYGFLEMRDHADALRVLRWTNNNPDVLALLREWHQEGVKDLVKALEKDAKGGDTMKAQLHRAKESLKEFEGQGDKAVKSKRTLILEFSIENILIVKKRASRGEEHHPAGPNAKDKRKDHDRLRPTSASSSNNPPKKRNRAEDEKPSRPRKKTKREESSDTKSAQTPAVKQSESEPETPKPGKFIGALIGRKRKLKNTRRGGG